jgi:hypothetical protein
MKLIYIIEDGHGNKKIGVTENIEKRIRQLKTAISSGISKVSVSNLSENALILEKKLHDANNEYRLNGEWFSEVVDFCNIDFSNFELKEKRTNRNNLPYEIQNLPEFALSNTTDLGNLFRLPVGTTGVLMCIATMVDYQGVVVLNSYFKEAIAVRLNAKTGKNGKPSISVVNKAITDLLTKDIINRIGNSTYKLNPNLFARGKWRDIYEQRKAFKMTITYTHDENGGKREIVTEQRDADIVQFPTPDNH